VACYFGRVFPTRSRFLLRSLLAGVLAATAVRATTPDVGIAVLHNASWSPNDAVREGAGEFEVLLRVAQLQHEHAVAGLVSVGDRQGTRQCGGELALRRAALTGLVVVKLAPGGKLASDPDELFVDAGRLGEAETSRILTASLTRHGAAPVAADPDCPTARELAAIHAHLELFQKDFVAQSGLQVALR
jgi:hypothetical protein